MIHEFGSFGPILAPQLSLLLHACSFPLQHTHKSTVGVTTFVLVIKLGQKLVALLGFNG